MNNASTIAVTILALCVGLAGAAGLVYLMDRGTGTPETARQPAPATPGTRSAPQGDSSPVPTPANVSETEKKNRAKAVARLGDYAADELRRMERDGGSYYGQEVLDEARNYPSRLDEAWTVYTEAVRRGMEQRWDEHNKDFRTMPAQPLLRHDKLFLITIEADYTLAGFTRHNALQELVSFIVRPENSDWRIGVTFVGEAVGRLIADDYARGHGDFWRIMERGD